MTPTRTFPFKLGYIMDFHPLSNLHGTSFPRGGMRTPCAAASQTISMPDELQSLPPGIDLSPIYNPVTSSQLLVDTVQRSEPFLPAGCELLREEDVEVIGPYPIDAGGHADVWVGRRNDGTMVAIKSHRCYSSSSCLPVFLVSCGHH